MMQPETSTQIQLNSHTIGGIPVPTVNARDLHAFLDSHQDFSNWIRNRIHQYQFAKNQDFIIFDKIIEKSSRGRPTIEYGLTLNMAKELAMIERTEKGKQARQYFIECEQRVQADGHPDPLRLLNDPTAMRGLLLNYSEKVLALEDRVSTLTPKAEALDRLATRTEGSLCITNAAKALQLPPYELFRWLEIHRWIYRRTGGRRNNYMAYQDKLNRQLLEHKLTTFQKNDGTEMSTEQVLVTPKGLSKLSMLMWGAALTIVTPRTETEVAL